MFPISLFTVISAICRGSRGSKHYQICRLYLYLVGVKTISSIVTLLARGLNRIFNKTVTQFTIVFTSSYRSKNHIDRHFQQTILIRGVLWTHSEKATQRLDLATFSTEFHRPLELPFASVRKKFLKTNWIFINIKHSVLFFNFTSRNKTCSRPIVQLRPNLTWQPFQFVWSTLECLSISINTSGIN